MYLIWKQNAKFSPAENSSYILIVIVDKEIPERQCSFWPVENSSYILLLLIKKFQVDSAAFGFWFCEFWQWGFNVDSGQ